ncbi:MAG: prepilin-type N-terminal cleavage/methylation domain-containing protein [Planctomycetota bacterium]
MNRRGLALLEIVVVVLIVGVIAAIAAPHWFDSDTDARAAHAKQTLAVLRSAISIYESEEGHTPPTTSSQDFVTAIEPFLNGPFPTPAVLSHRNANVIFFDASGAQWGGNPDRFLGSTLPGWRYNTSTNRLSINSTGEEGNW